MNTYIFLDIDGVLNSQTQAMLTRYGSELHDFHLKNLGTSNPSPSQLKELAKLDIRAVNVLNEICSEVLNPKIVISSTWRMSNLTTDEYWNSLFKSIHRDILKVKPTSTNYIEVVGQTKILSDRDIEIKQYLVDNNIQEGYMIILDDDSINFNNVINNKHIIKTDGRIGLSFIEYDYITNNLENFKLDG